ncbi:hypothetical protein [Streptomyces pathocidini]|uniref:hypothetical protein n=1 Tax=Streptomyces pathocidini TaxID=1650571 RepID=UPI003F4D57EB
MDTDDYVIDVTGLRRAYSGGFEAVRGITFSVARGELFALLGTNGAGKTSTVLAAGPRPGGLFRLTAEVPLGGGTMRRATSATGPRASTGAPSGAGLGGAGLAGAGLAGAEGVSAARTGAAGAPHGTGAGGEPASDGGEVAR